MGRFGRKLRAVFRIVQHLVSVLAYFVQIRGYYPKLMRLCVRDNLNYVIRSVDFLH